MQDSTSQDTGTSMFGTFLLVVALILGLGVIVAPIIEENAQLKRQNAELTEELKTTQQRLIDTLMRSQN